MIITKKKMRKQIADLSMDLEIINPIETKKILGGNGYGGNRYNGGNGNNGGWFDNGSGITIISNGGGGGSSSGGYWWDSSGGSYFSDWNNIDGNYGNGNGGGGGGDGDSYYDYDQKLPDLPATVPKQLNNYGSCLSYAMSFVSNYLDYEMNPLSASQKIDRIAGLLPGTSFTHGVTPGQAAWAIEGYFDANKINSIAEVNAAIDANHAVIANYITEQPTVTNNNTTTIHEVVIVEYNEWNYRIADSLTGQYNWVSRDLITFNNGAYEIVGIHQ